MRVSDHSCNSGSKYQFFSFPLKTILKNAVWSILTREKYLQLIKFSSNRISSWFSVEKKKLVTCSSTLRVQGQGYQTDHRVISYRLVNFSDDINHHHGGPISWDSVSVYLALAIWKLCKSISAKWFLAFIVVVVVTESQRPTMDLLDDSRLNLKLVNLQRGVLKQTHKQGSCFAK